MAPTKLPVKTVVIIKTCVEPSNTTSYLLFFEFFKSLHYRLHSLSYNRDEAIPLSYIYHYPFC